MLGHPAQDEELVQLLYYLFGGDVPGYIQCQALPGKLIDDGKYPKSPAIGGMGFNKVVAPDMVLVFWPQPYT